MYPFKQISGPSVGSYFTLFQLIREVKVDQPGRHKFNYQLVKIDLGVLVDRLAGTVKVDFLLPGIYNSFYS